MEKRNGNLMVNKCELPYNKELAKRFVSDCNLPIPIIDETFFYHLNCYEDDYGARTKYCNLIKTIEEQFNNDIEAFLKYYYEVRDNIIETVTNSDAYRYFNTMPMNRYEIKDKPAITHNNIFNEDNIGYWFISVDLKKANFQALNLVDKEILFNSDTYEDFISKFSDIDYIKESKYTRQVIFGKFNPKRNITVEKYYTAQLFKVLNDKFVTLKDRCISLANDEIIFKITKLNNGIAKKIISDIEKTAKEMGLDVRAEYFMLEGYQLLCKDNPHFRHVFFTKTGKKKLYCIPLPFHSIAYNLYKGHMLQEQNYLISYEGLTAKLKGEFYLEKLNGISQIRPEGTLLFNRNKKDENI